MLLLVATAQAALPWECPTLGAVPDGPQFRTDGGLIDTHDALAALVDPWLEGTCAWSDVVLDTGEIASTCTTSVGAVVVLTTGESATSGEEWPTDYRTGSTWSLVVDLPAGLDTWTHLALERDGGTYSNGGADSGGTVYTAAWSGAVLDLPDDASFTLTSHRECFFGDCNETTVVETPACDWSYGEVGGDGTYWVEAGGHRASVQTYLFECDAYPSRAYFDGVLYGHVDRDTWVLDEVDRDGWSERDGDCDDSDPTVYPCADDIPADGIDQDCDGADAATADTAEPTDTADTAADTAADSGTDTAADTASPRPHAESPPEDEPSGCATGPGGAQLGAVFALALLAVTRRTRAP